jgi:large subunit ribosomal protein L18
MKKLSVIKKAKRDRRHKRIRAKISGTGDRPRLSVFKSNKAISVQLIDDVKGNTLAAASTRDIKSGSEMEKMKGLGALIAEKAGAQKIKQIVFDRGGYLYTGKIKALADAVRENGIKF